MRRPRRATRPSHPRTCTPRIRHRVGLGTTLSRRGSARRTRRIGSGDTSARGPPSAAAWVGGPPRRGSRTASTRTPPRTAARAQPRRLKPPPRARAGRLGSRATATGRAGLDSRTLCSRRFWQSRGTRRRLASRHTPRGAARTASASATATRFSAAPREAFSRRRRRVGGASSRRAPRLVLVRFGPRAGSCPPAASLRRT